MKTKDISIGTEYRATAKGDEFRFIPTVAEGGGYFHGARADLDSDFWYRAYGVSARSIVETNEAAEAREAEQARKARQAKIERDIAEAEDRRRLTLEWGGLVAEVESIPSVDSVRLTKGWGSYGAGERPEMRVYFKGYRDAIEFVVPVVRRLGRSLSEEPFRSSAAGPAFLRFAAGLDADPEDTWNVDVAFCGNEELDALSAEIV